MANELEIKKDDNSVVASFNNSLAFEFMQRQATMLASSDLVPEQFSVAKTRDSAERNRKIANTMIALEMANRIGASPLAVLQNLYIVNGKPAWSSTFIIAAINGCGRFTAMKFEMSGEGDNRTCVAVATEKATGEKLDSPPISIKIAKDEGWFSKAGSKWKTMPELMLRYRAATLFGRLYAPEILMGMRSAEEVEDIEIADTTHTNRAAEIAARFTEEVETVAGEIPMTAAEVEEVKPEEGNLAQEVFALLAQHAKMMGETPDDMLDKLTNGKIGCQIDLEDKPAVYLNDIKLMIENAIAAEASKEA